jgi:hypothetical protein
LKRLNPQLARALKLLKDVDERDWYAILLDSANPIDEGGEAVKIIKVAMAYKLFVDMNPDVKFEAKTEAYKILRVAFDGRHFPPRRYLSKAQFGQLLDLHLSLEASA